MNLFSKFVLKCGSPSKKGPDGTLNVQNLEPGKRALSNRLNSELFQ